jgi:hypothetical protein
VPVPLPTWPGVPPPAAVRGAFARRRDAGSPGPAQRHGEKRIEHRLVRTEYLKLLIGHWFFARPLVLGATRGKENRFAMLCIDGAMLRDSGQVCKHYLTIFWVGLGSPSASWRPEAVWSMAGAQKWALRGRPGAHAAGGPKWPCFTGHGGQAQSVSTFS